MLTVSSGPLQGQLARGRHALLISHRSDSNNLQICRPKAKCRKLFRPCCSSAPAGSYEVTDRTTLKRYAKRAQYDRAVVHAILDEAFVCHIGFVSEGQPFVIPTGYARDGDTLYIHGSVGSKMLRALESGADICVTVTLLDGLVLARSQFNTDMNYRCVVVLGKARSVTDPEEKAAALLKLTEHIIPGRTQHARAANDKELSQTAVLAVDLNEVSAKVSDKNTNDDDEDYALPIWAGRVPLKLVPGTPEPDPRLDPAYADAIPEYILPYRRPTEKL
ncbi:g11789 [Coccomyxa elongata]